MLSILICVVLVIYVHVHSGVTEKVHFDYNYSLNIKRINTCTVSGYAWQKETLTNLAN